MLKGKERRLAHKSGNQKAGITQRQQQSSSSATQDYSKPASPSSSSSMHDRMVATAPMANFNRKPTLDDDDKHLGDKLASSAADEEAKMKRRQKRLCFCNCEGPICEFENTCIKHEQAACFHAIKQEFNEDLGTIEVQHLFGCAPLEHGSDGSHITCNAWRFAHSGPRSIACCYEGNYCNQNLSISAFPHPESPKHRNHPIATTDFQQTKYENSSMEALIFLTFGFLVGICLILSVALPIRFFCRKGKAKKLVDRLYKDSANNNLLMESTLENGALLQRSTGGSGYSVEDSGSGSGCATLNQRTIAQELQMLEMFARGRYGELRKAVYRGSLVAVKIFYTTEEESWRNEREIYLSQMLNHENILQYIAADITSNVESLTQMMLITDFHPLGSLYDYLRADFSLTLTEAMELAYSIISGIEHLHNPVRGTGGPRKPEIAHRDIKSKNVLVKRAGVCCLADFGLAVRLQSDGNLLPRAVNIQVGTKRYMAPELLARTLNVANFDEFKCADIYSFSLVLWEIVNRVDDLNPLAIESTTLTTTTTTRAIIPNGHGRLERKKGGCGGGHQRLMSHSNSSGIVAGSSDQRTSSTSDEFAGNPLISAPARSPAAWFRQGGSTGGGTTTADSAFQMAAADIHNNSSSKQHRRGRRGRRQPSPSESSASMAESSVEEEGEDGCLAAVAESQNRQKQMRRPHALPFQFIVDTDPSFEQMHDIVCNKKIRPSIQSEWANCSATNILVKGVCELMAECWSEQPRSRHTALKVKKELAQQVALLQQQQQHANADVGMRK